MVTPKEEAAAIGAVVAVLVLILGIAFAAHFEWDLPAMTGGLIAGPR